MANEYIPFLSKIKEIVKHTETEYTFRKMCIRDSYRYYGVTWNFRKITTFLHRVQQFLFKAMNRRGCRRAYTRCV